MSTRIVAMCLMTLAAGGSAGCGGGSDSTPYSPSTSPTYAIGGTLTGLLPGTSIRLLNYGADPVVVTANGSFQFSRKGVAGTPYNVVIDLAPPDHYCTISAGSGTIQGTVTSIRVSCASLTVVWRFPINTDGLASGSQTGVMRGADGALYGTTSSGGTANGGTIFRIPPAGAATTIWNFGATAHDGYQPHSGLIQASDGNFYGTTIYGGTFDNGTVYRLTPAGDVTVLWNFGGTDDGWNPVARLVEGTDGNLYGTTAGGGRHLKGTVFRLTKAGVESVLLHFGATADSGSSPWNGVIQATDGDLYGATVEGGTYGGGTLYRLSLAGNLNVLWQFNRAVVPYSTFGRLLQADDGRIYGIAQIGPPWYRLTATGLESVVPSPVPGVTSYLSDEGELIQGQDGNFYGTSSRGVYRLTPNGEVTVLWADFGQGTHASSVLMQDADGSLYGTTFSYGVTPLPQGMVFRIAF